MSQNIAQPPAHPPRNNFSAIIAGLVRVRVSEKEARSGDGRKLLANKLVTLFCYFFLFPGSLRRIVLVFQERGRVILTRKQISVHIQMIRWFSDWETWPSCMSLEKTHLTGSKKLLITSSLCFKRIFVRKIWVWLSWKWARGMIHFRMSGFVLRLVLMQRQMANEMACYSIVQYDILSESVDLIFSCL